MSKKVSADQVINALKKDPELLAEVKAKLDHDPELNPRTLRQALADLREKQEDLAEQEEYDSRYGYLHYCSATEHCSGGRNDCADWKRVNCPECLKSRPVEKPPTAGWVTTMVEHEWGQRDCGWNLWPSERMAQKHTTKGSGPGAPGQYFSYEGPTLYPLSPEVAKELEGSGYLRGKNNSPPSRGTTITMEHIRKREK